jgi:peptide/nickel transport system permease protein
MDNFVMVFGLLGVSIPNFWLGPMLILLFSVQLGIFNVSGFNNWYDLVLPVITLGTAMWAFLLRQTRSSVLDVYRMDFVTTAYAKGLSRRTVLYRHILRNALIPVVTVAGLQLGALLSGAVITERVFALPGLGDTIISAVKSRDYPVVQGAIILISITYVIVNIITDIIYTLIDPRIEL